MLAFKQMFVNIGHYTAICNPVQGMKALSDHSKCKLNIISYMYRLYHHGAYPYRTLSMQSVLYLYSPDSICACVGLYL